MLSGGYDCRQRKRMFSMCAKTTPEVPTVQDTAPGSTIPLPTALAAWSPPPPTTGVPSVRPVSSAARRDGSLDRLDRMFSSAQ